MVEFRFDFLRRPSRIIGRGDPSSSGGWRAWSTREGECVIITHFVHVRGGDWITGWNKEFMASLIRVECSHYAKDDEVTLASYF